MKLDTHPHVHMYNHKEKIKPFKKGPAKILVISINN